MPIADCSVVFICLLVESECTAVHWLAALLLGFLVMHFKFAEKHMLCKTFCMVVVQTIMFVKHSLAGRPFVLQIASCYRT
jgi:hypothetical protein